MFKWKMRQCVRILVLWHVLLGSLIAFAQDQTIISNTGIVLIGRDGGSFSDVKVGIGIKQPKFELHIYKQLCIDTQFDRVFLGKTSDKILGLRIEPKYKRSNVSGNYGQITYDGESLRIYTGSNHIGTTINHGFTMLNNGNIGIGNINPDAKLVVDGDVKISGKLEVSDLEITHQRRSDCLVLSACDFIDLSTEGDATYIDFDEVNNSTFALNLTLVASLKLPNGAKITKIQCYWTDNINENGECWLRRRKLFHERSATNILGVEEDPLNIDDEIAYLESRFHEATIRMNYTNQINYAVIDNHNYSYYFHVILPSYTMGVEGDGIIFHNVKVHYEY